MAKEKCKLSALKIVMPQHVLDVPRAHHAGNISSAARERYLAGSDGAKRSRCSRGFKNTAHHHAEADNRPRPVTELYHDVLMRYHRGA